MNAAPLVFAGFLGLSCAGALAQATPGSPAGKDVIPKKEAPQPDTSNDGGVIKPPPSIDPDIVKPAPVPHPHSTPVIPPPGTPGGPPGPEPK